MKKTILLTSFIVLWNILWYFHGWNEFRSQQSYRTRELLSVLYKTIGYLLSSVAIFRSLRKQNRNINWHTVRGPWTILFLVLLITGKWMSQGYSWMNPHLALMPYIYVLVVNSLIEEYVFRWVVFTQLQKTYALHKANILQAISFWIIHIPFYMYMWRSWLSLIVWIGGIICLWLRRGYVKKQTWSLFYPALLHSIRNGVLIFM